VLILPPAYPLADCQAAIRVFDSFYPISFGSSSLLFLFRVRAVFGGHRFATWAFGILWISTLAASITIPIGSTATKIGSACIVTQLSEYVGVHAIAMTLYDTSVFLAISYRLLANSHVEQTPGDMITALFRGANLPAFSNALFRDGQKYYLCVVRYNFSRQKHSRPFPSFYPGSPSSATL
jgi:hypothetical protein